MMGTHVNETPEGGMIISGRTSLLALIDQEKAAQGLTDAELLRRAGMARSLLYNLRKSPRRCITLTTALALVNALGLDLTATSGEN